MINAPLFKRTLLSNYKILIILMAVLTLYFTTVINMYDPNTQDVMATMLETLPKEMIAAMGMTTVEASLLGFISTYLYGFLILLFPMIFDIIVANRLIAGLVDKGAMSFLLSTPTTRRTIAVTQATFLIGGVFTLLLFATILGLVCSNMYFPGELDISAFIQLNLGALLLHLAIAGICFFASCLFNDTKNSLTFGAGIPIAFFLFQMMANIGGSLEKLKYVTIFTLYDVNDIITGATGTWLNFTVLGILAISLFIAGVYTFHKKDLPL